MSPLPMGEGIRRPPSDDRRNSFDHPLDIFHMPSGNTVGPVEEMGIVSRPAGDKEEVLLRAFQSRNSRLGVMLQMLQLRVSQPCAAGIFRHASCAQDGLQRNTTI